MQHADPAVGWIEWTDENKDADEATRLAVLREYIFAVGRRWVNDCTYDAAWANKKFAKLGITDRIQSESRYVLRADVTGTIELAVYGFSRTEALETAKQRLNGVGSGQVTSVTAASEPAFVEGPEDVPATVDDDAPQTVDATLAKLREVILFGHIAGPKICEPEANRVLASFGLDSIPPRKTFKVSRPVTGEMSTTVEAYDEASAQRVAGWRWENGRSGHTIDQAVSDEPVVTAVA